MQNKLLNIIDKAIIILIKGTAFLLPLFFLPWTENWFEFNRQYLLWFIVPVIIILWLIKVAYRKEIVFRRTPLDIPILVFLAIYGLVTIFSIDKFSSLFGHEGVYSYSFLGVLSLVLFYFILTNFVSGKNKLRLLSLIKLGSISYAVVAVVIILAVLGLLGNWSEPLNPFNQPRLDYVNSLAIAKQTLEYKPILGSGPATFSYDFSLYRDQSLNKSNNWLYRFNKSSSYILDIATGTGVLGLLSYALILSLFYYLIFILLHKIKKAENNKLIIYLVSLFSLVLVLQFVYPANSLMLFLFWSLLALIMVNLRKSEKSLFKEIKIDIGNYLKWQRMVPLIVFIIAFSWLLLATVEIKYWLAEHYSAKDYNKENHQLKAYSLNPHRIKYQIDLSKLYLNQAKAESSRKKDKRNNQFIQLSIDKSIRWARKAVDTQPNSVLARETLGMVYRDVRLLTTGSEPWAVRSFKKATELEPTNPVLWTELGKAYLENGQEVEAAIAFRQAFDLKEDYYEAQFGLAKVYVKEKKEDQALIILDNLAQAVADPEVFFEQGRLYYNQGEINLAIESFNKTLAIQPNHVNALYGLGLAYQLLDKKEQALKIFKKILEYNPDSEDVKQKIKELEK